LTLAGVSSVIAQDYALKGNFDLDKLEGQLVDISPWAYVWRADRAVQEQPEAYFIPHRLERIDTVYRTAYDALPPDQLKSIYYNQPDLLKPLLPKPKGSLLAGLLWVGGLSDYQIELLWPAGQNVPAPEKVEVRVYPTAWGWFGWTVDRILNDPVISKDGLTWTYKSVPGVQMDWAYSQQVDAATEMLAVFHEGDITRDSTCSVVPTIRLTSPIMGTWQQTAVEIEWGFEAGTEKTDFDGRIETRIAMAGPVSPLTGDTGTTITNGNSWQSKVTDATRRGIIVPLLYTPKGRPGLDSRVTVWTKTSGFTFRVNDLEKGPILIPEQGVFITKAGSGKTARQFTQEVAAKNLKSISQMTREHREASSWDELMQEVRLWTCPEGTTVPPFPQVEDPPMLVQVPDARWTDAWRVASFQLKGPLMWGGLAFEVARVTHAMNLVGLNEEAEKVYEHFLKAPGAKPDGDFLDGSGALEWALSLRHDMGYSHDGTHASTGRMLFSMAERYFLTGDKEWFQKNRLRLQAAADWIIRQRKLYMMNIPNREDLFVAGLMPPYMLGDYALPACDWHWYYCDDALSLQGVQRFADALMEFDPEAGRKYHEEAEVFRKDIRRAVEKEAALAPVRLGRDGTYRTYLPRMAYAGGIPGPEFGAPHFPEIDFFLGALPLAEPFAALDANDFRVVGAINVMAEQITSDAGIRESEEARKNKVLSTDDAWFWKGSVILPKVSHNANIFLLQDDVPNFLRFWTTCYAAIVGANGKLWEPWHLGDYTDCTSPDNGTAGWFMENFRNLLVMELDQSLWIARATPRVWLEQGKQISVQNAPTYFGTLAYEITSDVDNGKISATVEIPNRNPIESVIVRFRHPQAKPIQSVMVNSQPWTGFDPDKETIELKDITGSTVVVASY
jgi:hypothetical protein